MWTIFLLILLLLSKNVNGTQEQWEEVKHHFKLIDVHSDEFLKANIRLLNQPDGDIYRVGPMTYSSKMIEFAKMIVEIRDHIEAMDTALGYFPDKGLDSSQSFHNGGNDSTKGMQEDS